MTKSAFEIRYDLLQLSYNILLERFWAERNRAENDWNSAREVCLAAEIAPPPAPTVDNIKEDDIITLAAKLNAFVSNG